jgi:transcription termination/antitermination protein NusA
MVRLKLDQDSLGLSSVMENITHARVKDTFKDDDTVYFVVATGDLGKAVGKGGLNIKRIQEKLAKRVRIFEYHENAVDYLKSVIYPLRVEEIVEDGGFLIIRDSSMKTKGQLIGRDGKNLSIINRAVKRFFNLEVKVA